MEKLENIEKAVAATQNTVNEDQEEATGNESTTDEGVVVTFENVTEGADDGLRKRKESMKAPSVKETAEVHGTLFCSIYFNSSKQFKISSFTRGVLARGYKTFFMLNSTEHGIFPAHKS